MDSASDLDRAISTRCLATVPNLPKEGLLGRVVRRSWVGHFCACRDRQDYQVLEVPSVCREG